VVPFSAKIESELAELPEEDRADFLASLGLESAGLDRLIRASYQLLGLETYFTPASRRCARGRSTAATRAQGRGVSSTPTSSAASSRPTPSATTTSSRSGVEGARARRAWCAARGKEYVVHDGDVMLFKFNV
jgi:ribosome-binding ATPase YchF (GTP1/OBG family)